MRKAVLFFVFAFTITACVSAPAAPTEINNIAVPTQEVAMDFKISSPAFTYGASIPKDFSCRGKDISPALSWTEPPAGTQSFALILDDPDAPSGTWVHWVIYNIPASARDLKEGTPTDPQLSDGSLQGITSAGSSGYHGPCPPSGTHRYFFKLYALDTLLTLSKNSNAKQVLAAMESHILAKTELMGMFSH